MNASQELKVLFLTSSYPRSKEDNASVFLRYMAEALASQGITIHVVAPAEGSGATTIEGKIAVQRFQYFFRRFQKLAYGSGMIANLKRNPWLWLEVPFFIAGMLYAALRALHKDQIDVIHAHWIIPQGIVGAIARRLFKIPLVTTAHGADAFALRNPLTKLLKRVVINRSDAFTANTRATSQAIGTPNCMRATRIIPMGVNVDLFRAGSSTALRQELAETQFLILFVGRLIEKKGCHDLLLALSLLNPSLLRQTKLWIVGDGDQKTSLEKQVKKLALRENVRFWGAINNQNLPDFYAAADLFVAPSTQAASGDTEGQGVVLLEAFAAQVCAIATRIGGIEEVITNGVTGLLVQPNSPQELATAIESLLNHPKLRAQLAANAFEEVTGRYSWNRIAAQFETIYRDLVNYSHCGCDKRRGCN